MKLLICSDGSEQAERAIRLGAAIAGGCHAEVTLLGITENPGKADIILDSLRRGQALLADKNIPAELITKAGEPVTEIIKRTEEATYDLILVGAVRKDTRGAFWLSSKTYKIIKEVKPPVLCVAGKSTTIKRILICSGGKRYIDAAVRIAGELARCVEATATILHVLPDTPAIFAHLPRMEQTAETLLASNSELGLNLRHEKETLEALGVKAEVRLRFGPVLDMILDEAREGEYDLVVTGSAPSKSLRTYMLGDISREVVNRVRCAVLVVRSRPEEHSSRLNLRRMIGDW